MCYHQYMNNLARGTDFFPTPVPPLDDGRRYTYADYKKWDDDIRREVIGGRVYMMGAPTTAHQGISASLSAQFYNYLVDEVFAAGEEEENYGD
jgi:hypothetical protein